MIITRTPFRVSLFGGGTDIPHYFNGNGGGSVVSFTIDKYVYVSVRKLPGFFWYTDEVAYSQIEQVDSVHKIKHPLIRNAMISENVHKIRLTYESDLPARSGLGSSSSFAVGMLKAFNTLKGLSVDKYNLAKSAIHLERDICDESGGWQDQVAASYGGFNFIEFKDNDFEVSPINIAQSRSDLLQSNLVLVFSGFTRLASDIERQKIKTSTIHTVDTLKEMRQLSLEGKSILESSSSDIDDVGRLLDYTWKLKKSLSKVVSTDLVDTMYDLGIKSGALGGKLLGAGGGGFMLFYITDERKPEFYKAFRNFIIVPLKIDYDGSIVLFSKLDQS